MEIQLKGDERIDQLMQYDLEIIQSPSVFSFSLDAVLLGDFAKVPKHDRARVVDLCSGNGAVALMLSQKTKSKVMAMELQERLADMAERSIKLNHLTDQVAMIHSDVNHATEHIKKDSVDVLTCNPPYFTVTEKSRKNPNAHLAIARHELHLTLKELMTVSSGLLKTKGKAYFVHRPERFLEIMDEMRAADLAPKRIRFVYPKPDREANMLLIEGIKQGKETGLKILPPLFVFDENGDYYPEVRRMIYGNE
ncbi:tRNA1(Val) A37 N6-methylase TrmN6 [Alkalibacterium subtropicum]|uniref:tRNA1(Val) A37 N6-methylase TrmN6 n=1 Tax=Alkalibacterium subtropicum TaxID=753702 RepID=A0A1I1INP7_9LACT|nr:tRNA1(Val) (adenine(37)-N6)-methyltransferase [Alkalibacterium subtropicum]SFC35373.1 tRNA1(Val) A37 N6-methylase TrmN6 [Alkalibacterium subtropicum]